MGAKSKQENKEKILQVLKNIPSFSDYDFEFDTINYGKSESIAYKYYEEDDYFVELTVRVYVYWDHITESKYVEDVEIIDINMYYDGDEIEIPYTLTQIADLIKIDE